MRRLLATTILLALVSSALAQLSNQKQTADSKLLNGMPATLGYAMARALPELCGTPDHSDDFAAALLEEMKSAGITSQVRAAELVGYARGLSELTIRFQGCDAAQDMLERMRKASGLH